jgi:aminopeptidase N
MLESYLGEETFRKGINSYLRQHAYGNAAAADLWNALAQASGKPVDKIMASVVDQPGPPMVSARAKCEGGSEHVKLSQQRYVFDRSKFEAPGNELWQIPVCMKDQDGAGSVKCELLTEKEHSFNLPACTSWVDVNSGARGFYRSAYDEKTVQALAKDAEDVLTPAERIMLLNDVWSSVRVDRENIGDYLRLAEGLASDPNPLVNEPIVQRLEFIGRYLVNDSDADAYRAWVHRIFKPLAEKVGWEKKPGDKEEVVTLRSNLLALMGRVAHDPDAEAAARKIAEQALSDSSSVPPALAVPALTIAANSGDEAFYDKVLEHLKAAKDPELKNLYERTLVSFHDPKLEERTLQYGLTQARSQDASLFIARVMRDAEGEKLAWDFVRNQWTTMERQSGAFGGSSADAIVASTSTFCTPELRSQVEAFFSSHPVPSASRTLKQSLEEIGYCIDMKGRQGSQLGSWLQGAGGRAGK